MPHSESFALQEETFSYSSGRPLFGENWYNTSLRKLFASFTHFGKIDFLQSVKDFTYYTSTEKTIKMCAAIVTEYTLLAAYWLRLPCNMTLPARYICEQDLAAQQSPQMLLHADTTTAYRKAWINDSAAVTLPPAESMGSRGSISPLRNTRGITE